MLTDFSNQTLECRDCGKPLEKRNSSGFCRTHSAARQMMDPEAREKMARSRRMMFAANPEKREEQAERMRRVRELPQARERRGENLRGGEMTRLSNAVRPKGSAARMKAGARISATKLAWCPPHLRPLYREIRRGKGYTYDEAKALVLETYEAELARFRRKHGGCETNGWKWPPNLHTTAKDSVSELPLGEAA